MALDYGYTIQIQSNGTSDPSAVPTNQWQRKLSGQPSFTNLTGETGSTYVVSTNDTSSEIRLQQSFNGALAYSNPLTVTSDSPLVPPPKSWTKVVSEPKWYAGTAQVQAPDGAIAFAKVNGERWWVVANEHGVYYSNNEWANMTQLLTVINFPIICVYYNKYVSKWVLIGKRKYVTSTGQDPTSWNPPVNIPNASSDVRLMQPSPDHKWMSLLVGGIRMFAFNWDTLTSTQVAYSSAPTTPSGMAQMEDGSWVIIRYNGTAIRNPNSDPTVGSFTLVFTPTESLQLGGSVGITETLNGRRIAYANSVGGIVTCDANGGNFSVVQNIGGIGSSLWNGAFVITTAGGQKYAFCSRYGTLFFVEDFAGPRINTGSIPPADGRQAGMSIGYDPESNVLCTLTGTGLWKLSP